MRLNSNAVRRAAVVLLIPVFLVAGCQKQNAQQGHERQTHEKFAGGGRQKIRAVCADDIQKYCANAERKRRCLKENMDKLSDACKAAVGQRGGRRSRDNDGGDD
ncbi:MAG TPA: hypothetical protein VKR31_01760 [Rhizomicrobium sp.]|nr:hypothetical protein [Rhizomicrobium sp.]